MKKILTILALTSAIGMSFSGTVYANDKNINTQTDNKSIVAPIIKTDNKTTVASTKTYTFNIKFDFVGYVVPKETVPVSAGQNITITWSGNKEYSIFLENESDGKVTSFKDGTSPISYTNLKAGNYLLHVHDLDDDSDTPYYKEFTIRVS